MSAAAERVVRAWTVPGPSPATHALAKARLRRDWPTLAEAVETLVAEQREGKP